MNKALANYEDFTVTNKDYITAARFFNICRKHGIQGSQIDFLICAVAVNNNFEIFSMDKDFFEYKKYIDLKLFNYNN